MKMIDTSAAILPPGAKIIATCKHPSGRGGEGMVVRLASGAEVWTDGSGAMRSLHPDWRDKVEWSPAKPPGIMDKLAAEAKRRGYTHEQIGRAMGVDRSSVTRWFTGQRSALAENLEGLASAIGCELELKRKPE